MSQYGIYNVSTKEMVDENMDLDQYAEGAIELNEDEVVVAKRADGKWYHAETGIAMSEEVMLENVRKLAGLMECGCGMAGSDTTGPAERITWSQSKNFGPDSSLHISANANSTDELYDMLRMAGIDAGIDYSGYDDEPEAEVEPEVSVSLDASPLMSSLKNKLY